jgi:hypothetical protein
MDFQSLISQPQEVPNALALGSLIAGVLALFFAWWTFYVPGRLM